MSGVLLLRTGRSIYRSKAFSPYSLYIRVNKSYVRAGESYEVYVFENFPNQFVGYSGYLEVCVNYNLQTQSCNSAPVSWTDFSGNLIYVKGGKVVVNIPKSMTTPFTAKLVLGRLIPIGVGVMK